MEILGILVIYIIVAITASIVAGGKGRSPGGWFFLCLLLTPFAILILLVLPDLRIFETGRGRIDWQPVQRPPVGAAEAEEARGGQRRPCPFCAELILPAAHVCRFCSRELPQGWADEAVEFALSAIEDPTGQTNGVQGLAATQPDSKPPSLAQDKSPINGTISVVQEKDKRFWLATIFAVVAILVGIFALAFITRLDNLARGAPEPASTSYAAVPADRRAGVAIPKQSRASSIGPGFDCTKAAQPLPRLICSNPELSRTDLLFNQAYQALRQQLVPAGQRQLAQHDLEFLDYVKRFCGVPDTGAVTGSPDCVAAQYDRQRERWLSRLSGPAREEANRPIEQHVALQADLQRLGFLPSTAKIDGVYSAATRAAIVAWQHASGRPATGLIGDADAAPLGGAAPLAQAATLPAPGLSSSQQITAGCDPSEDVHLPHQLSLAEKLKKFPADLLIAGDTRVVTSLKKWLSYNQSHPETFANASAFHRAQCGVNSAMIDVEDELKALKMLPPSPPIAPQPPRKINGVYLIPTIPCQLDPENAPFSRLVSSEIIWPAGHNGDADFMIQQNRQLIALIMNSLSHPGVDSDGHPDAVAQAMLNDPVAHAHHLCWEAYELRELREEIATLEEMKARLGAR